MAKLMLVRGLPGSGKSWFAKNHVLDNPGWVNIEADHYFVTQTGYVFDARKRPAAHAECQQKTRKYLAEGFNVVVSNTFTQLWEMKPYLSMGADSVEIVECTGQYGNVHGVPEDKVRAMAARWEEIPPGFASYA